MKKLLALALSVAVFLGVLAACGGSKGDDLTGLWRGEVDLSDALNAQLVQAGLGEFTAVSGFAVTLELDLKDDGAYALGVTADLSEVKRQMKTAIDAYFAPMLEGQGISVDDALAASGTSVDAILDEALGQQALDALTAGLKAEGQYTAQEGQLSLSADPGQTPEGGGLRYTRADNTLTLNGDCAALPGLTPFLPLTLTLAE